ncbi:unnamed protein product [Heligmosomoides polygyrus]|uniref:Uncharacterized protein n=1 Tax=Heligmosomoides polygyrus TaxID=6339 RepID=A0A3P8GSB0_HELPZ|nr:unnamed protein product [Heligmosomoides polygyrus]
MWRSFYGIEEQLKRSNSMPDVANAIDEQLRYWPPPPGPIDERLRMRKALGQNVDNSVITQDFLEKVLPAYPKSAPRYVATVSAPPQEEEEDSPKAALIRSLEGTPEKQKK